MEKRQVIMCCPYKVVFAKVDLCISKRLHMDISCTHKCTRMFPIFVHIFSLQYFLSSLQASKIQYEKLEVAFKELQDAHTLQTKFIRKLEKRNKTISGYRETIENQERVISNMQAIIEERVKPKERPHFIEYREGRANPMVAAEIYKLNKVLENERDRAMELERRVSMEQQLLQEMKERAVELELGVQDMDSADRQKEEILGKLDENMSRMESLQIQHGDLKTDLKGRHVRVKALEEQLTQSARDAAQEISRLKMRLLESEMMMTSLHHSDDLSKASLILGDDLASVDLDDPKLAQFDDLIGIGDDLHQLAPSASEDSLLQVVNYLLLFHEPGVFSLSSQFSLS